MDNIRIRTNTYEIDVSGTADEVRAHLDHALEAVRESLNFAPQIASSANSTNPENPDPGSNPMREGTINTVVSQLSASSCREILIAAAAHLTLFEGCEKFTTKQWTDRAKDANAWKKDYSRGRAAAIKKFVEDGRIVENSSGVFSLPENLRTELNSRLSN